MSELTNVKVAIEDRVGVLTIDHPPANALDSWTLRGMNSAMDSLLADDRVKVIVITGGGRFAFAAGADVREMAALSGEDEAREYISLGHSVLDKIETSSKPVIAAMNALALGGGLELALACHLRILSETARVGQPESNLGLIPGWGGTQRLPRLVGHGKALELILTGDLIEAPEALRLGIVNRLAPAGQVLEEALAVARKLAGKSALVNAAVLRAVVGGLGMLPSHAFRHETDQFTALIESHDAREGLRAFLEKRPPEFTDR